MKPGLLVMEDPNLYRVLKMLVRIESRPVTRSKQAPCYPTRRRSAPRKARRPR